MKRLLLVQDDQEEIELVRYFLRKMEGLTLEVVRDGEEAQRHVAQDHGYDLIILDLGLPKVSGLEILQEMRSRGDATKVIVSSGSANPTQIAQANSLGIESYVFSDLDLDKWGASMREAINKALGTEATPS